MKILVNERQQNLINLIKEMDIKSLVKKMKSSTSCGSQRKVVFDYLDLIRESGICNMFEAAPLLCNGKQWVKSYCEVHRYRDIKRYDKIIKKAGESRDAIIQIGLFNYDKEKIEDEEIVSYVERNMIKIAKDLLSVWMFNFGNRPIEENIGETFSCSKCSHSWKLLPDDKEPFVCHNCHFDNVNLKYKPLHRS